MLGSAARLATRHHAVINLTRYVHDLVGRRGVLFLLRVRINLIKQLATTHARRKQRELVLLHEHVGCRLVLLNGSLRHMDRLRRAGAHDILILSVHLAVVHSIERQPGAMPPRPPTLILRLSEASAVQHSLYRHRRIQFGR